MQKQIHNISIIGSGYIGLVIGTCLADFGNKIIFADNDPNKIDKLKNHHVPIYEQGIEELLIKNLDKIDFTTNIAQAITRSQIIFIAVNTPTAKNGSADISAIENVARIIAANLNEEKIICIKSTVPIGTSKIVEAIINSKNQKYNFEIVSMPEFLREGCAINDFMNPDRIIIGTKSKKIFYILKNLFSSINCPQEKIIFTDNDCAETIKYISNSFLALKVSFINEIANFCDEVGVDALSVANGVGLDSRIGNQFLKPGPGFGGSCFPKDVLALINMAQNFGIELKSVNATIEINNLQKRNVVKRLKKLLNDDLQNKTIAILGLAFKANTDDIRQSPAIDIINQLLAENATIKAYDPKAMANMKIEFQHLIYCNDSYDACHDSDAILLLTEWQEFAKLDFKKIYKLMKQKIIFDTRNILDINELMNVGFEIDTIGRSCLTKHNITGINRKENYLTK